MKNNILEIIPTMGDGGAETLVKDYLLTLNKDVINASLLTIYKLNHSANLSRIRDKHINVISVFKGTGLLMKLLRKLTLFTYVTFFIYRFVKKNNISCIHVHLHVLHSLLPIIKIIKNVRIFYTIHNTPEIYFSGIMGRLEFIAVKRFVKYSNFCLIALHEDMAKSLSEIFDTDRIEIIRNGVDFNKFTSIKETKLEIRKKISLPLDGFIVGHVGRFNEQKNHKYIISVFSELLKKNTKSFLLLIGSGPLKETIIEDLQSKGLEGKFMILSQRTDIPELMKAMDVFLFPSLYEGLPVTLIEAQVSKLPCVVSDRINESAIILPSTVSLSLDSPLNDWVDSILHDYGNIQISEELSLYDMNKEIVRLEQLYTK